MSNVTAFANRVVVNRARVAELNDALRASVGARTPDGHNRVVLTRALDSFLREGGSLFQYCSRSARLMRRVRDYIDWGNDPYGERDMGGFSFEGQQILFKIDYYDRNLEFGSERPDREEETIRVLTIMLASDY